MTSDNRSAALQIGSTGKGVAVMEEYKPPEGTKYTFREKLENFWYHYKWHSVIALFLIFAITVCTLQFCSKKEYDAYVMYAGPYDLTASEVRDMKSSLAKVCPDANDDGEINVSISNLFLMTEAQIEERNAVDDGYTVNTKLVMDNSKIFDQQIAAGEYMIFLLDPSRFMSLYSDDEDKNFLMKLDAYLPKGEAFSFYNECGVYLSSTPFADMPGFSNLPEDTILCIRAEGSLTSIFHKKEVEQSHKAHETLIKNILSYK